MSQLAGLQIGRVGFGLMGLTWRTTPIPDDEAIAAMKTALEAGCNLWSGSDRYGTPENNSLHLVNKYFTKYPEDADKVVFCAKGGLNGFVPDGSPEYITQTIEQYLKVLDGKKSIDIYMSLRVDKNTPIETTLKALEGHVQAGHIKAFGLSEASSETIEKAVKVAKIACVETELSLSTLDIFSNGIAQTCAKHNIPIIAYSPLGRGILTGELKSPDQIPDGDIRKFFPRFSAENLTASNRLAEQLQQLAKSKGGTGAQLALGWIEYISKKNGNPEFIPIPGSTSITRIKENSKPLRLEKEDVDKIESLLSKYEVKGARYDEQSLAATAA